MDWAPQRPIHVGRSHRLVGNIDDSPRQLGSFPEESPPIPRPWTSKQRHSTHTGAEEPTELSRVAWWVHSRTPVPGMIRENGWKTGDRHAIPADHCEQRLRAAVGKAQLPDGQSEFFLDSPASIRECRLAWSPPWKPFDNNPAWLQMEGALRVRLSAIRRQEMLKTQVRAWRRDGGMGDRGQKGIR